VAGTNHDTAFNNNLTLRCVRRTWWLCLLALPAWAQPAASPSASAPLVTLDPVAVTGSHLARTEIERALPVTTLAPAEIEIRDATQPADLLTAVPQITGLPANETATLGATARGDNATVALRGLQSADTLLLLDGRRLAPHPISQFEVRCRRFRPTSTRSPAAPSSAWKCCATAPRRFMAPTRWPAS
jgi:outer membrane receptor for ferrienterochelin and colicin